jgi:hypothetical protein
MNQPWKAFWRFSCGEDPGSWSESEFPEVLSWKFDPANPFDRPWRAWTRTELARKEVPPMLDSVIKREPEMDGRLPAQINQVPRELEVRPYDYDVLDKAVPEMRVVNAKLNYLAPLAKYGVEKPYLSRLPALSKFPRTNIIGQDYDVAIRDVSGNENFFTLDDAGFEFAKMPSRIQSWTDDVVREQYIPALTEWLKSYFHCITVHIYAYNVCCLSRESQS